MASVRCFTVLLAASCICVSGESESFSPVVSTLHNVTHY